MSEEAEVLEAEEVEEETRHLPAVRANEAIVARAEISVEEVVAQRDKIVEIMRAVMTEGVHYGTIPGVDKPSLFKPGAEAINVALRLAPHYEREKDWHMDGHLTVTTQCTLKHITSDLTIATGGGMCSTREEKYAYRKGSRKCPACGAEAVIKGKAEYGGGWLCWAKRDGCGAKFSDDDPAITGQEVGRIPNENIADSYNCVTPETRILTRDLRWVPAGELVSGDVLIGVREEGEQYGRPYEYAIATVGDRFEDDLYEVKMSDGRVVRCNGEHRWLVKGANGGAQWISTKTIHDGMTRKGSAVLRPDHVWEEAPGDFVQAENLCRRI